MAMRTSSSSADSTSSGVGPTDESVEDCECSDCPSSDDSAGSAGRVFCGVAIMVARLRRGRCEEDGWNTSSHTTQWIAPNAARKMRHECPCDPLGQIVPGHVWGRGWELTSDGKHVCDEMEHGTHHGHTFGRARRRKLEPAIALQCFCPSLMTLGLECDARQRKS